MKLFLIGMLMGIADLIPGISSGTVAYSLNIYQIWLDALSSISLKLLLKFKFKEFFKSVHFHSLVPILLGAALSVILFINIVFIILNNAISKEFFFIIISFILLFSCVYFSKTLKLYSRLDISYILIGILTAIAFSYLPVVDYDTLNLSYVFIAAAISSFAMILPGISGSAVLLLFNLYELLITHIREFLNNLLLLQFFTFSTIFLTVFSMGVLFGVAVFSKLLKTLLKKYQQKTNLVLFGLMLGCAFYFATIFIKACLVFFLLIALNKFKIVKSH